MRTGPAARAACRTGAGEKVLGLSAWKVMLVMGVVALLFLPRLIRMGDMVKGLARRLDPEAREAGGSRFGMDDGTVIDGDTGYVVPKAPPPPPKPSLAERIGLMLGRLTRRITQRLSA
ncbi:hypothetical protein [Geminicoccus flavidas]|uniref:hypothetical protein n=1 Tax=Geminicoccus flavidas TaxID=2506407 RepID=UPI001358DC71|nr:hypothetical protein [Geminicoccus flavidas]